MAETENPSCGFYICKNSAHKEPKSVEKSKILCGEASNQALEVGCFDGKKVDYWKKYMYIIFRMC